MELNLNNDEVEYLEEKVFPTLLSGIERLLDNLKSHGVYDVNQPLVEFTTPVVWLALYLYHNNNCNGEDCRTIELEKYVNFYEEKQEDMALAIQTELGASVASSSQQLISSEQKLEEALANSCLEPGKNESRRASIIISSEKVESRRASLS